MERVARRSETRVALDLENAFWFPFCSLMQQSSVVPRGASTRLIALVWWLFALIIVSSYTANLAATATVKRMETPIEGAEDLSKQSRIRYGTLGKGSTMTFFNESKIETYERMWKAMSEGGGTFVQSSREGIQRVKNEDYAYLMESTMLEYAVERDCQLTQVGGLIDQKGYGIGLPKGSPHRAAISRAILSLQENTLLTELKNKWWRDQSRSCGNFIRNPDDYGGPVAGLAMCLLGGLVFSTLLSIIQYLYSLWPRDEKQIQSAPTLSALLQVAVLGIKAPQEIRRKIGLSRDREENSMIIGRLDDVIESIPDHSLQKHIPSQERAKGFERSLRKDRERRRTLTTSDMKTLGF